MTTATPVTDSALPPLFGPGLPTPPQSALSQVFHVSPLFRGLRFETRDLRFHPQLGGISSTRWQVWNAFIAADPELTTLLSARPSLPLLLQLIPEPGAPLGPLPSLAMRVDAVVGSGAKLAASGILSGDGRANRLVGSREADVLLGWGGNDELIGRGGGDSLSGGEGADRFVFRLSPSRPAAEWKPDTITDFNGSSGDRLVIRGMTSYRNRQPFSGSAGEVRFSPGLLQADLNGDGLVDRQIHLPGVIELRPRWLDASPP